MDIFKSTFILAVLIVTIPLAARYALLKYIRRNSIFLSDDQRRWMSVIKNTSLVLIVVGLMLLWWPEIERFILSITAVALALVLATKELILCLIGSVVRTSTRAFTVGDWIEINRIRGEVTDLNLISTVMQEIDIDNNSYQYTGKTINIPNSMFLSNPIRNMNFLKQYVYHRFSIITEQDVNVFEIRPVILDNIEQYSRHFIEIAQRYNAMLESRMGLDLPSEQPEIVITNTDLGHNVFTVTIFCPTHEAVKLEQVIRKDFMELYYQKKLEHASAS
jgi:small-conductance mechanosensitive channel